MSVALRFRVAGDVRAIVATHDALAIVAVVIVVTVVTVVTARLPILLVLFLLLLPLRLQQLFVAVVVIAAAAENRKGAVRITTSALGHQFASCVVDAALVNRVVVAFFFDVKPAT